MATVTITRQQIFEVPTYSRTKFDDKGKAIFLMNPNKNTTLRIGHNAVVSMESVPFATQGPNELVTFFTLTLVTGKTYYIDDATVQTLIGG